MLNWMLSPIPSDNNKVNGQEKGIKIKGSQEGHNRWILLQELYDYQQQHAVASQDGRVSDLLGDQVGQRRIGQGGRVGQMKWHMVEDESAHLVIGWSKANRSSKGIMVFGWWFGQMECRIEDEYDCTPLIDRCIATLIFHRKKKHLCMDLRHKNISQGDKLASLKAMLVQKYNQLSHWPGWSVQLLE